ncbi:SOS response-associated peptidase family protein [Novosphingobium album (ex Hu et al. 2023)]|uniref:SOS response-associated peptidase n=1 Tax=Novosphingobium album (ex Hu et al. 2023) TaxID=2930093 RepID=A0ABT0B4K8_9SPHN|nr:SOS response-associated peptidase family protein [Novosphingobium album (ex Hu et al. 2023)]MCJ2179759.1 SOS response-associated peptidase [Novosphingobium album (ex Hu et al. 2023)]
MPTLYRLDAPALAVGRAFNARVGDDPWAGGHVAPGQFAPVITAGREFIAGPRPAGRKLETRMIPRLWGVPPPPSVFDARPVLTVRNLESPFWIGNLRNSEFRCLIPATAFMEWGKVSPTDGKRRQCWFSCADQPLFAMAAVWKDSEIPGFALLACPANAALRAEGRDTMPVILPPDPGARDLWLHGGWDRAKALVQPYSSSLMEMR